MAMTKYLPDKRQFKEGTFSFDSWFEYSQSIVAGKVWWLNEKCPMKAHVFKHLFSAGRNVWEGGETFRRWSLNTGSRSLAGVGGLKLYSPDRQTDLLTLSLRSAPAM